MLVTVWPKKNHVGGPYLDIEIDVPAAFGTNDALNPVIRGGLCGNFDGEPSNDYNIVPGDGNTDLGAFINSQR